MEDHGRFYWLKLKANFFKRHDMKIIKAMPNGKDYLLFYLNLLLESLDHNGRLRFSDTIPYNEEMLAVVTDTNVDIVRQAIKVFTGLELVEILDDGTYYMREIEKLVGSETAYAEKKRIERAKTEDTKELVEDTAGTKERQCLDNVSQSIEYRDKSIEIRDQNTDNINNTPPISPPTGGKQKRKKPVGVTQQEAFDMITFWTPNVKLRDVLLEFIANRTEKDPRDIITKLALSKMFSKLDRECEDDAEKIETVENSIMAGYKGLFPKKQKDDKKQIAPLTPADRRMN